MLWKEELWEKEGQTGTVTCKDGEVLEGVIWDNNDYQAITVATKDAVSRGYDGISVKYNEVEDIVWI